MNAPFAIGEHRLQISASVGIANSSRGITDSATLMRNADVAMYHAKLAGRHGFRFFTPGMDLMDSLDSSG
jgi:predicted signal transduction protein with EAL and GGDEF domain